MKKWKLKQPNLGLQKEIAQSLEISFVLAQILINRGISSAREAKDFLYCERNALHDAFLLKGMEKSVNRIEKAISLGQKIMVWGDYDIDGITSCALLTSVLRKKQAQRVFHYLPNRLEEGYGLNDTGVAWAKKNGIDLLITVDCGISAAEYISDLKKTGIDTIVTDHHHPTDSSFPESAWAVINPLQKDCAYPYKYLAGVGIAAKLAEALTADSDYVLTEYLDIITLGTVGDVVPLTGENRILVKRGLETFSATRNLGLKALMEVAGLDKKQISARDIGYVLGPRINASGRLGAPDDSYHLLLADSEETAYTLAKKLDSKNRQRQQIESRTLQ
ncbi:MAG: DHH family phosphoesterase, partial [Candidatus Omnitrophota bacterium]